MCNLESGMEIVLSFSALEMMSHSCEVQFGFDGRERFFMVPEECGVEKVSGRGIFYVVSK